jgi:hypothetical protein
MLSPRSISPWAVVLLLAGAVPSAVLACPPPCAPYHPYYVVLASENERAAAVAKGKELATKLGSEFPEGSDPGAKHLCGEKRNCLQIVISQPDNVKTVYAVAYLVMNGYRDAREPAIVLLNKVRPLVKDAYLKAVEYCACE